MYFDFLIPKRPVSVQTKNRANRAAWKSFVRGEAAKTWEGSACSGTDIQLTLVYLYDRDPLDADNIIKPIQDSLRGLVYDDDSLVTDVESHRRPLAGTFDLARCPAALLGAILSGTECVYVRLCTPRLLEEYL
jgi:crossover junction endodeoxyribonuclease RusA